MLVDARMLSHVLRVVYWRVTVGARVFSITCSTEPDTVEDTSFCMCRVYFIHFVCPIIFVHTKPSQCITRKISRNPFFRALDVSLIGPSLKRCWIIRCGRHFQHMDMPYLEASCKPATIHTSRSILHGSGYCKDWVSHLLLCIARPGVDCQLVEFVFWDGWMMTR